MHASIIGQVHDELIVKVHKSIANEIGIITNKIMCDVSNLYLENVEMKAEHIVADTWIK